MQKEYELWVEAMDAVIVEEASMTREALDQTFVRTHTDRLRLLRLLSMNLYDIYHKQSGKWYCIQLSYSTSGCQVSIYRAIDVMVNIANKMP